MDRVPDATGNRGLTPVVGVLLLVALTLVLAATVSATVLRTTTELTEPAPTVAHASGEYERYQNGGGRYTEQVIRITHLAGESVTVADIEIAIDASTACRKSGRLVNLPASGGDPRPTDEYVRGDDVFDNSYGSVTGPLATGGEWTAGETGEFRLATSECRLEDGEGVTVRVVHVPTASVVIEESVTAS